MTKLIAQKLLLKMVQEKRIDFIRLIQGTYTEYAKVHYKPLFWWITEVWKCPPRVISTERNCKLSVIFRTWVFVL